MKFKTQWRLPSAGQGLVAALLIGSAIFCAVFADWISPMDPNRQDYSAILQAPSAAHWLGTDHVGRDVLSRLIHGSRVAMVVGFAAVAFAVALGSMIGIVAGYFSGIVDEIIMRVVDALLAFPSILLALGIMAALGPSLMTIIIAIGLGGVPLFARLARGQVLSTRERDFVTAAVVMGAGPVRVMYRHIWPHITGPIVALGTLHVGMAILTEAALSFLGLGIQPPTASWGSMLRDGFGYMDLAPWISVFSGLTIFLTVLGTALLGDALRESQDPRVTGARR